MKGITRLLLAIPFLPHWMGAVCAIIRNSTQIKEEITELSERVAAILDIANEAKRNLTQDEVDLIDKIHGKGKKGAAGYVPGEIDALEAELDRMEKIEAAQRKLVAARAAGGTVLSTSSVATAGTGDVDQEARAIDRIQIPVRAQYRYGKLKAFKHGPLRDCERSAYMAGRVFAAWLFNHASSRKWCENNGLKIANALSEGTDGDGGYLVPTEVEQAIIDLREEHGVFRRDARIIPMRGDTKTQPVRSTGLTAYFADENAELTDSDKSWSQLSLVAKKMYALCRYSKELDEDALINIGDDLAMEIAIAFAAKEDDAAFNGDGQSGATYGGISGLKTALAAGSKVQAGSGHTTFGSLTMSEFETVLGALPQYAGIQPKWYISKAGWAASMQRLLDAAGGNTIASLSAGAGPSFLGYPVVWTECLPKTLAAQNAVIMCYFGDLRLSSVIGQRRGLTVATSDQRYFEFDQIAIRGTQRLDIKHHSVGTSNTAGAVIGFKTAATS